MPLAYRETTQKISFIFLFVYVLNLSLGGVVGFYLAWKGSAASADIVQGLLCVRPSTVYLVLRSFVPLGVTYLALRLDRNILIQLVVFVKTGLMTFTISSLLLAYPHAGWLITALLLAPACLTAGIYHWLWLRILVFKSFSRKSDLWITIAGIAISLFIELFFFCPFTASLFTKM